MGKTMGKTMEEIMDTYILTSVEDRNHMMTSKMSNAVYIESRFIYNSIKNDYFLKNVVNVENEDLVSIFTLKCNMTSIKETKIEFSINGNEMFILDKEILSNKSFLNNYVYNGGSCVFNTISEIIKELIRIYNEEEILD